MNEKMMSAKATSIIAYLSTAGLIIAFLVGDREGAKFHLNQALVLSLFALTAPLMAIPCIGWIYGIFYLVCWIMGIVGACKQKETKLPLFGKIKILN